MRRALRLGFCPGGLGLLDEVREPRRVSHGEIGENLAVDLNAGSLEPVHQLTVRHPRVARGRADALDPQRAELAFPDAAVAVRKALPAVHPFPGPLLAL